MRLVKVILVTALKLKQFGHLWRIWESYCTCIGELRREHEAARNESFIIIIIIIIYFISFAIPKYNNYNYYHKAYIHKLTTHLSTRAIPQLPHKVMPTVILQVLFKKEETNHFCKRRKTN